MASNIPDDLPPASESYKCAEKHIGPRINAYKKQIIEKITVDANKGFMYTVVELNSSEPGFLRRNSAIFTDWLTFKGYQVHCVRNVCINQYTLKLKISWAKSSS